MTQRKYEPAEPTEAPLVVLKRRLAAGEISVDEYDALRTVIDEGHSPTSPAPAVR